MRKATPTDKLRRPSVAKTKKKTPDAVSLLTKALKHFKKLELEDVYGYSAIGMKLEKGVKTTQKQIEKFLE